MKILIAILLPPLAILLCGRPFTALLAAIVWLPSAILSFVGFGIPTLALVTIYAIYVVMNRDADKRVERLAAAMGKASQAKV